MTMLIVNVTPRPLLTLGKDPVPFVQEVGWPQGRSGQVQKISPPPGFDPWTVQPVALLVQWSRKSRAIPLLPLRAVQPLQSLSACTVQLYLHSLHGSYGLFRASVRVQYSYTSTPPMGRTACSEPQCVYSTAIPSMGPTACTDPQCLYSTAILLLPYGPYGLYTASVPVQYSYTSTPPMGRTACSDPQCLYSTAIPLLPLWAVRPVESLTACTAQLYLYPPP